MATSAQPTSELARFIAALEYEQLPERVRERVKDIILDSIASALAGHSGDETAQIGALARELGEEGPCTIIGGDTTSAAGAALVNAYLITAVTVCDVHRPTLFHTTPQVVPAAFLMAERKRANGKALLTAVAAGLEVSTRVALGTNYKAFRARGWHSPGVVGPFGGAAAVGKLLRLDAQKQRNAFGLAGSQSAGTFAHWGTPTIKFHQCRGSLSGLMAGILAAQGFSASAEILAHEDGGIYKAYSDGGDPAVVTQNLGERWRLEEIALRLWPAASSVQAAITALFELIRKHAVKPSEVSAVDVGLSKVVYDMHGTLGWNDKFKALLSMPYITSIVLHDNACWLEQFAADRFQDPAVDAFARNQVKVSASPDLQGIAAAVTLHMKDGKTLVDRRSVAKGDPDDPLSRDEIRRKLATAAKGVLGEAAVERIAALIDRLETLDDTRELFATLRRGGAGKQG